MRGTKHGKLWRLQFVCVNKPIDPPLCLVAKKEEEEEDQDSELQEEARDPDLLTLHQNNNHSTLRDLKRMAIAGALDAVSVEIRRKLAKAKVGFDCPECGSGKVKFKRAKKMARTPDYKPGQYWQTDHSGPYPAMHGGAKYSTVFVEYQKRFTYVVAIRLNTIVIALLKNGTITHEDKKVKHYRLV